MEVYQAMILFRLYAPKLDLFKVTGRVPMPTIVSLMVCSADNQNALYLPEQPPPSEKTPRWFCFYNKLHLPEDPL